MAKEPITNALRKPIAIDIWQRLEAGAEKRKAIAQ
jgi:hypothetical protein